MHNLQKNLISINFTYLNNENSTKTANLLPITKNDTFYQEYKDYYTGIRPKDYHEYSVDRIDSTKGYVQGNIVITTNIINVMKGEMSIDEFLEKINILYNNRDKIKSLLS